MVKVEAVDVLVIELDVGVLPFPWVMRGADGDG